jgi:hypothetical protein
MSKLTILSEIEGYQDPMIMLEAAVYDSVAPGICTNVGCEYACNVEPDQRHGWCEHCNTTTVESCLSLAGFA